MPDQAWPRLAVACDSGEAIPPPIVHATLVSCVSIVATLVGAAVTPGLSGSAMVAHVILAFIGYAGAAAVAVEVAKRALVGVPEDTTDFVPRYAASASMPLAVSGIFNFVPFWALSAICMAAGAAMTYWSAHLGAAALLGLEGDPRKRAATTVTVAAGLPVALSLVARLLVPD